MLQLATSLILLAPLAAASASTRAETPKVPEGFQIQALTAPGSLRTPIAFTFDGRGRLFVLDTSADGGTSTRVLVFADSDLDGSFEQVTTHSEGGQPMRAIAVGYGGLWALRDDALEYHAFEGETEPVRVLEAEPGQVASKQAALLFGPDGWLYGSSDGFAPDGASVWRVHPSDLRVEPFAYGSDPMGALAFDVAGHLFGITSRTSDLQHVVAGAHIGPDTSSRAHQTTAPIEPMEFERPAFFVPGAGTFELGGQVPVELRDQLLVCDWGRARVSSIALAPNGSSFSGTTGEERVRGTPERFRPIALSGGPDGALYVLDAGDGSAGFIWRVTYGPAQPQAVDLHALSDSELVARVLDTNEWWVRRSTLELARRKAGGETHAWLRSIMRHNREPLRRLRALRALAACDGLDEDVQLSILRDRQEYLQAWGARLVLDAGTPPERFAASLVGLAARTTSLQVRLQLAGALAEVPDEVAWTLAAQLVGRAEDAHDPNIPSLLAHGVDRLVPLDPGRALGLLRAARIPVVIESLVRGLARDPAQHEALVQHLVLEQDAEREFAALQGFDAGMRRLRDVQQPPSWPVLLKRGVTPQGSGERGQLLDSIAEKFSDR